MESLMAIPILAIAASYFEIYKVKTITVAYKDQFGNIRGYKFDYAYPAKENWMDISAFEKYVAAKKNLPEVRITRIQVKTRWKLRRA